jgi:hypothetical protein
LLLTLWLLATPAQASPAWTLVVPFGVPQFAHGKRKRGLLYAGLQAVGLSASTVATVRTYGYASAGNDQLYLTWRMISAGTVAFTAAAWFASSLDGSRLHQLELEAYGLAQGARDWDHWHSPGAHSHGPSALSSQSFSPRPTSWGVVLPPGLGIAHGR